MMASLRELPALEFQMILKFHQPPLSYDHSVYETAKEEEIHSKQ